MQLVLGIQVLAGAEVAAIHQVHQTRVRLEEGPRPRVTFRRFRGLLAEPDVDDQRVPTLQVARIIGVGRRSDPAGTVGAPVTC